MVSAVLRENNSKLTVTHPAFDSAGLVALGGNYGRYLHIVVDKKDFEAFIYFF